jgi:signal transduction histidine kinase
MATFATILVVDRDPTRVAGPVAAVHAVATETDVPRAVTRLGADEIDAVIVGDGLDPDDVERVCRAAAEHAVPVVLGVAAAGCTASLERALELGCVGVLPADAGHDRVAAVLAGAKRRRTGNLRAREEVQRLHFRADELRRRCMQQAERFQESQETFFLDLSRMMTIITNIMDGIVFSDRAGHVTLLNPVAEDLLGTKSFVAVGKALAVIQGRRELLTALAADQERLLSQGQTQKEVVQTVEVHHSEQDLLYIKCITSRVLDYRGQPAGTLSLLKDVTAEFKTDQLKNQYLSIVAHELRTPLTGIKTFSTMMTKGTLGALTERQLRVCESIREQSLRLEHQIDKLINLGNLESADYGQDREVVTVSELVAGLLAPFEQSTRDRRIELSFEVVETDAVLFADRADLRRACQALVENAVKFTPDGGHVHVRIAARPDGQLCFGVRDDGIGVDPRYHRRIFEKFFQVEDPLTRHHGGAGLGLFVAKGIVEAHGSRIEVSSQLGSGADFSFALPMQRQPVATTSSTDAEA